MTELAAHFDVTTETVRRDLSVLERLGLVAPGARRRRPGRLADHDRGRRSRERDLAHTAEKERIAARRARPAARGRRHGAARRRHAPPSGSPRSSPATAGSPWSPTPSRSPPGSPGSPSVELHLLPGRVRRTTQAAVGADTVAALDQLRADVAFIGTNGITVEHGLSTPDRDEAATKRGDRRAAPAAWSCSPTPARSASRRTVRFADARRDRHPGHRRRASPTSDRKALEAAPAWRCVDRMIVTLTANPSHDRTVALAGPLERGAVQRAASVTSQAGGKGVNISRAAVAAGVADRSPCSPPATDDPFVHRAAARPASTAARSPPDRRHPRSTSPSPSPTAPPPSSTAPAPTVDRARTSTTSARRAARAGPPAATGWCWPARCRRARPTSWYAELVRAAARHAGAGSPSTPARARCAALVDGLPGAAPDLMKPNGEELASFTGGDADDLEADPAAAADGRARRCVDRGVGSGAGDPRRRTAPSSSTADGAWHATPPPDHRGQHRRRRRLQPVRLPARPTCAAARRPTGSRSRSPTAAPPPACPAPRSPTPTRSAPSWSGRRLDASPQERLTPMADLITADLVRLDADLGSDKHDVIRALAGRRRRRRARQRRRPARRTTRSPARRPSATGLPGGIAIPHCRTAGVDEPTLAFARLAPGVDFGAKDGPADLAFLIAAPAGGDATHLKLLTKLARALVKADVHRRPARRRHRPRTSSSWSAGVVGRTPPPTPVAAGAAAAAPAAAAAGSGAARRAGRRRRQPGRGHRVPDRHRPHLHGGRGPRGRGRRAAGVDLAGRDPGLGRLHPAAPRRPSPAADAVIFAVDVGVRDRGRFAGKPRRLVGRQAPDRRRRRDDRRGAALRRRPERPARRGRRAGAGGGGAHRRRARPGAAAPAGC